ncbi:hypothetical protein GW17_00004739 [Ensete ventricosum]|nr:hypothetical protein GW17_00004739 [Ensete ventricosum]
MATGRHPPPPLLKRRSYYSSQLSNPEERRWRPRRIRPHPRPRSRLNPAEASRRRSGLGFGLQKWSKGKQKEKVNNAVLFDQVNYDKMLSEVPKFKQITPSVLSERLRVKRSRLYPVRWIHFRILHHFTSRK